MYTVEEFANKHKVTAQWVYRLIAEGRLKTKEDKGVMLVVDKKLPAAKPVGRPKYRRD